MCLTVLNDNKEIYLHTLTIRENKLSTIAMTERQTNRICRNINGAIQNMDITL